MDKKYIEAIKFVSQEFWGEPTLKNDDEWRFGNKLSKAVNLKDATYFDFEENEGGGLIDLITKHKKLQGKDLSDYLYNNFRIGEQQKETKKETKVVEEYNYKDENNNIVYQVIRLEPKSFRQRRIENGKTIWGLNGIDPLPYNLPEILKDNDKTIFIVEGEKDADRLMGLGFLATTNSGGSKNWKQELNKWFKDRRVMLIPDNDTAGYEHIDKIAQSLLPFTNSIHLLSLADKVKDKGDISDYLDSGGDMEELILSAVNYEKSPANVFQTMAIDDILSLGNQNFLVENLMPEQGMVVLYGQPASYKSFVAIDLCLSISSGMDWQGFDSGRGKCLYIASEGVGGLKKRIKAWLMKNKPEQTPDFHVLAQTINFLNQEELDKLIKTIRTIGDNFELIVVDTVARALSNAGSDENSASDMGSFISACDYIRQEIQCTLLAIHHSGKNESSGLRGSSALLGGVDTSINCRYVKPHVYLGVEKQKDAESIEEIALKVEMKSLINDTSVTLEKVNDVENTITSSKPKLGANQKLIYDIVVKALDSDVAKTEWINADCGEQTYVNISVLEFYAMAQLTEKTTSHKNQALKRSLLALQNKEIIGIWNDKVWLV